MWLFSSLGIIFFFRKTVGNFFFGTCTYTRVGLVLVFLLKIFFRGYVFVTLSSMILYRTVSNVQNCLNFQTCISLCKKLKSHFDIFQAGTSFLGRGETFILKTRDFISFGRNVDANMDWSQLHCASKTFPEATCQ